MTDQPDEARATELRNKVVDELKAEGTIASPRVEAAMRKVPRHLAVPETALDDAYHTYNAVITLKDGHGNHLSSVSAPQIQAIQLEQAGIQEGDNVLEIGTNGPNAAYAAELAGPTGHVTTVDIDPAPASRAREFLDANGYHHVQVVVADAEDGVPDHAPYDVILVTVGAWDIPPAWTEQLTENGRLIVPLRINGLTRSYRFVRDGDALVATSALPCGFVPMQGVGAHHQQSMQLPGAPGVTLNFDDDPPADPSLLAGVLDTPRAETWTGVSVAGQEPISTLQMFLAAHVPTYCNMAIDPEHATGRIGPTGLPFSMVAIDGPNFGYAVVRRDQERQTAEFGFHTFGPDRLGFAERLADTVRTWGEHYRSGPDPRVTIHPAGTPADRLPGRVVDKTHSRVSISWPSP
ncbi:methyltransferase, FxLD system [Streptomyces sp. MS19]|uniref:methyltransferase, FxLD system n=1 Tax=Streptomyces sp. MS19 TaxID=3385972 RepID=UPI0039A2C1F9